MSRESLQRMRSRLRPAVTACFAAARAGRPTWSGRATLRVVLRYSELVSVDVPRSTDPGLASCLAHVADEYADIPYSDMRVAANFSFHSEGTSPTPPEEPSSALDRALSDIGIR